MKPSKNRCNDADPVFGNYTEREGDTRTNYRRYYRNLILRSVITFFAGTILMAFFEALGLGGLLFGAALLLLGGLFFKFC